jgi:serine kinase of HPr protein (carbohydrate metabolism regulator)
MKKILILGKVESANEVMKELINFLYNFKDEENKKSINEILNKKGIPMVIISNDEEALEFPHPAVNLPRLINYDNLLKIIRLLT